MALKFLKCGWQKVLFIVLLVITILVILIAMLVNRYWSPIVSDRLKSTVLKSTDGLYQVSFDKAELHVLKGKIIFNNITLKPNAAVYDSLKKLHIAPNNLYELHVKKLVLNHIHPFSLYFLHKLDIGSVVLSEPHLRVSYQLNHARDTIIKDKRTLYQQISQSLKMIRIEKVLLNDVKLRYENHKGPKVVVSELQDLNLSAIDLLIDSTTQYDKTRFLYCREMDGELNNYSGKSANGLYSYKARQVTFSTLTSQLNAYDCSLIATHPPAEFFEHTYKDRFVSHLDSIQLNNFNFDAYNKYHTLSGSKLTLTNGGIDIFGNPRVDPKGVATDRISSFPNDAIHKLSIDLKIDTVDLRKITLTYEEYNKKTKRAGKVSFNNTHGHFYNVTNDSAALAKNNLCKISLNTWFMNKGSLDVDFTFNLTDQLRSYGLKGSLGTMNFSAVNVASVPLASVAIKGGQVNKLSFDIKGNRKQSSGEVTLLYNDLKVQLLKADTAKLKMRHMTLVTLLANALIIRHNNPDKVGDEPRTSLVTMKRPIEFPFFKTVWRTILTGLKPSFGFDDATQRSIKARIADHQKSSLRHKQRKAIRVKRREEKRRMQNMQFTY